MVAAKDGIYIFGGNDSSNMYKLFDIVNNIIEEKVDTYFND